MGKRGPALNTLERIPSKVHLMVFHFGVSPEMLARLRAKLVGTTRDIQGLSFRIESVIEDDLHRVIAVAIEEKEKG